MKYVHSINPCHWGFVNARRIISCCCNRFLLPKPAHLGQGWDATGRTRRHRLDLLSLAQLPFLLLQKLGFFLLFLFSFPFLSWLPGLGQCAGLCAVSPAAGSTRERSDLGHVIIAKGKAVAFSQQGATVKGIRPHCYQIFGGRAPSEPQFPHVEWCITPSALRTSSIWFENHPSISTAS